MKDTYFKSIKKIVDDLCEIEKQALSLIKRVPNNVDELLDVEAYSCTQYTHEELSEIMIAVLNLKSMMTEKETVSYFKKIILKDIKRKAV